MEPYVRNPKCSCARCRAKDLMGAALIISTGVLLLLQSMDIVRVHQSWPVILLVVGAFLFLGHTASTEGHVQPYGVATVSPQPWTTPTPGAQPVTPASPQAWGPGNAPAANTTTSTSGEPAPANDHHDEQVNP
jgi:hypothetical protein